MNNHILKEDFCQFAEHFKLWEQLRGKTFLVTGATGLIGSVLVRCLLTLNQRYSLGIVIYAVIRDLEKAKNVFAEEYNNINFLQLELSDVTPDKTNSHIDFIIHLASPTSGRFMEEKPVETFDLAYQSTLTLLKFAKQTDVKSLVYVSSLEYYGQILDDRLITEDLQGYVDSMSARSSYPMGKRAAEYLCFAYAKEYGTPAKIARLTQTLGAGISENDNRVFAQFARSAVKGQDIVLNTTGESSKPYCYTIDAIGAIMYILLLGKVGEVYNVANSNTYISIRDLANFVKNNFNNSINIRIDLNGQKGYAPVTKLRLSTDKLENLGWTPRFDLNEMFKRLIEYLQ